MRDHDAASGRGRGGGGLEIEGREVREGWGEGVHGDRGKGG